MNSKFIFLSCLSLFLINQTRAQSFDIYNEFVFLKDFSYNTKKSNSSINFAKSVKIEHEVNELLDPIIELNSSEKLKLSFDILASESTTYAYTFIHCDSDWQYSDITQSEYLNGFFDNYINNFEYSFNTLTPYVNYNLVFPNEDVQFKKSGNYVILVYDTEKNTPVLSKRFMIHEDILNINMSIKIPSLPQDRDTKQEIDFYIKNFEKLNIIDPTQELKIIIQKNYDWNNIIDNCKPSFVNNKVLEFDYQGDLSFNGGNEFFDFDMKSLRYLGKNVYSIEQKMIQGHQIYCIDLFTDKIKNEDYEFKYDLNGKYVLSVNETKDRNTEGDYALVKFTLINNEVTNQNIYVYGELTNWDILPEAEMKYDSQKKYYYCFLYLKQGYYNYQYVISDESKITYLNNNYSETRNQYSIYTYHTPSWGNYDRLVGISKNTSNALK